MLLTIPPTDISRVLILFSTGLLVVGAIHDEHVEKWVCLQNMIPDFWKLSYLGEFAAVKLV